VTYVATGPDGAGDGEWAARVRAHRQRRPAHWGSVETTDLAATIAKATTPLLIDGLGTWVAAVFDEHGAWEGDRAPVHARCDELVAAWRQAPEPIVAVSDEVGLGVVPATASGRAFRDVLGRLNERLAAESEYVALVVAGRLLEL
jgi:adenosylcobinamide kinase/adenosylcobinamide-phosphate guanylyltransferase